MSMQMAENFKTPGFESCPGQGPAVTVSEPHHLSGAQVSHMLHGDHATC